MNDAKKLELKKLTIKLSAKIQEYLDNTAYIKLPLRASHLENYTTITKLLNEAGYKSLSQYLHKIVDNKLDDLLEGFTYNKRGAHVEWFFNKSTRKPKAKRLVEQPQVRELKITLDEKPLLYFSEKELLVLETWQKEFETLVNGTRQPVTELQERFIEVAKSLLEHRREKITPKHYYEKVLAKYLIYRLYMFSAKPK